MSKDFACKSPFVALHGLGTLHNYVSKLDGRGEKLATWKDNMERQHGNIHF